MVKGQILCQAVSNKLEIFDLSKNLASAKRFEIL